MPFTTHTRQERRHDRLQSARTILLAPGGFEPMPKGIGSVSGFDHD